MKYARIEEEKKFWQKKIDRLDALKQFSCRTCQDTCCMYAGKEHDDCCPSYSDRINHVWISD